MADFMREAPTARLVRCEVSGAVIRYCGYGRPPKYAPHIRKELEKQRRADRYQAKKQAAKVKAKKRSPKRKGRAKKAA